MSQHQAKSKRRTQRNIIELLPIANAENLVEYINSVFKDYPGWKYISISPSNNDKTAQSVVFYIHKTVPMLVNGSYHSVEAPIYVKTVAINSDDFPGVVISRKGDVAIGNPFSANVHNKEIKDLLDQAFADHKREHVDLSDADVVTL